MLLCWGIVIYAVQYLGASILMQHPVVVPLHVSLLLLTLIVTSVGGARLLHLKNPTDILPYSIAWVVCVLGIDMLVSLPFAGWTMYSDWHLWANYALIVVLPLLAPFTESHRDVVAS